MLNYNHPALNTIRIEGLEIASFITPGDQHIDEETVRSFGAEWTKFSAFSEDDIKTAGDQYFDILPSALLKKDMTALDLGCGTGRWSLYLSDKIGFIEAIDPSTAVLSAARLTAGAGNIRVSQAGVDSIPFADESFDLIICLGVLHHLPKTGEALKKATTKLKKNGLFLLYLYYNLDNKGKLYQLLFKASDSIRKIISKMPTTLKKLTCELIAVLVYLPFVSLSRAIKTLFKNKSWYKIIPLSYYADKSFTIIRNDALDRFGTPLEQRFSRKEMEEMMIKAGLGNIVFSAHVPFWHALGQKK